MHILCTLLLISISTFSFGDEQQDIDAQITTLRSELKELRRNAFNNEMNAQPYMFDNWHQYAGEINSNEENEKKIKAVKAKISELKKRKQALQNQPKE